MSEKHGLTAENVPPFISLYTQKSINGENAHALKSDQYLSISSGIYTILHFFLSFHWFFIVQRTLRSWRSFWLTESIKKLSSLSLQTHFYERYRKTVFWDWQLCVWPNWNRLRDSRFDCARLSHTYKQRNTFHVYLKLCFLKRAEKIMQRINEVTDNVLRWTNLRCRE